MQTDVLIIGAGPAGMAAAMELSKKKHDFLLVEKCPDVGGLATTYTFKEGHETFLTDNGPHRFFSKNKYLYDFIEDLLGEEWIKVERHTQQFIDGKFYDYPINAKQAMKNIGFKRGLQMMIDYLKGRLEFGLKGKPIKNFEDYIVAHFGRTLGNFNMINYTEKIWGIPAETIHADWARQRIKGLSLRSALNDAVQRALFKKKGTEGPKTLVDAFYYPEFGTGTIYQTIHKRLIKEGYKPMMETYPLEVRHKNNKITEVVLQDKHGRKIITPKHLIESIPIVEFVKILEPKAPQEVMTAIDQLRYRSQVYLFVTLNKPHITNDQWIYFPDKEIPFARISEMKNFSHRMAPKDKTSLFIEFFCFEGDSVWNMGDDELFTMTVPYFEQLGFFARKDVRHHYVIRKKNVYPIYDLEYIQRLDIIKKYLDSFENLLYIGRPGRFQYNNQDHSLEMGILAARSIFEGKRFDFDTVGAEKEYFEKGTLPPSEKSKK